MQRILRIRYGIRALLVVMLIATLVAWYFRTRYLDASYFPMALGDRWVYASKGDLPDDVIFEVVGTERVEGVPCFVVKRTIGKHEIQFYISVQQDGVRLHRVGDDVYRPPYRQFAFPTKNTDSWTWKGTIGTKPAGYGCTNYGTSERAVPHGSYETIVVGQVPTNASGYASFNLARGVGVVALDGKFADEHDPVVTPETLQEFHWELKEFNRSTRK